MRRFLPVSVVPSARHAVCLSVLTAAIVGAATIWRPPALHAQVTPGTITAKTSSVIRPQVDNLLPFVNDGDSAIVVFTQNPSTDDNIFFASLELRSVRAVVGEGITLGPSFGRNLVGTPHAVTALVRDASGQPRQGVDVTFAVIEGPNTGVTGSGQTTAAGTAAFEYVSDQPGVDAIVARFTATNGDVITSNAAIKLWEPVRTVGETCDGLDNDGDGRVDEGFPDTDGDGIANCIDDDEDNDGVPDGLDNCPLESNPDQADADGDRIGDACDLNGPIIVNPRSPVEIRTDGQFGPPTDEWQAITPGPFLDGDSFVYSAVEGQDIYLMYDYRNNGRALEPGERVGPISFQIGGGSFFDVFVTQGGPNTMPGPNPPESQGGTGDTVQVFLNGVLFDNSAGCVAGAVDYNSTSPNFPEPHTLVELEVRLTGFPGGCYSPEPAFWSATLPSVRAVVPSQTAPSEAALEVETDNVLVGLAFFTITENGSTEVSPLALPTSDAVPPVVTVPADTTVEATGSAGAPVTYSAAALDDVDGAVPIDCRPPSGSTFRLGATVVRCVASDRSGNTAEATFTIRVRDTTPPALTLPGRIVVNATSGSGATVVYHATAADLVDGAVTPSCNPSSGSVFAINVQERTRKVRCTATDRAGNVTKGSFTVHVNGAAEQIRNLDSLVASLSIHHAEELLLRTKLAIALAAVLLDRDAIACSAMGAFNDRVRAQTGQRLTPAQGALLLADSDRIRAVLGCRDDVRPTVKWRSREVESLPFHFQRL